jgi:hypothetical protein
MRGQQRSRGWRMAPRGGSRREGEAPPADGIEGWFAGRLPEGWFERPPTVTVDRDEVLVVGRLPEPPLGTEGGQGEGPDQQGPEARDARVSGAEAGRIARFREQTRAERMAIADEAAHRFGRKVAWGAECGQTRQLFTVMSVPVMTRLRQPERLVLDTLVDAGVARSRSEALAWCVRLVGRHADDWLGELREAMTAVQRVREQGPT